MRARYFEKNIQEVGDYNIYISVPIPHGQDQLEAYVVGTLTMERALDDVQTSVSPLRWTVQVIQ